MKKLNLNECKLAWHGDRVAAWLKGYRIAPITVDMALTQACNMRCTYCYGQFQKNPGKGLSWDEIRWLFDDFKEIGVKAVSLVSDGESTMSYHLWSAVEHAKQLGLDIALGTNGLRISRLDLLKGTADLTYLRFNISAMSYARFNEIHRPAEWNAHEKVLENIRLACQHKGACTVGLQMVFLPEFADQVLPLVGLAKGLGADYLQIKHCSDDPKGSLGVDYRDYEEHYDLLKQAEALSDDDFQVIIKWDKIKKGDQRSYQRCYAPAFIAQFSGSGVAAPCGSFFHQKYFRWHYGDLHKTRFRDIFKGDRYWNVLASLGSLTFDAQRMCCQTCLQDAANVWLNELLLDRRKLKRPEGDPPAHVNFAG